MSRTGLSMTKGGLTHETKSCKYILGDPRYQNVQRYSRQMKTLGIYNNFDVFGIVTNRDRPTFDT